MKDMNEEYYRKLFSKNLNRIMNERRISQADVIRAIPEISKASISAWCNGTRMPRMYAVDRLAEYFKVPRSELICEHDDTPAAPSVPGAIPLVKKKIPLLGRVACGVPIYSEEEHEVWLPVDIELDAAFAVLAVGDSMIGAGIHGGDHVFIRPQPAVDNGTIALVAIGDEYTLKRVYYYPDKHKLILNPENPAYEPLIYSDQELEGVRIIGKFIGFLHLEE
jgi:repressor LexA